MHTYIHTCIRRYTSDGEEKKNPHAAQTSFPTPSIQFPSWLTLESQSCSRSLMLSICFISSTLGCTQLIRATSATWSMLPRSRPRLSAFMIRISISCGWTLVSLAIVANVIARSCGGRRNTASVSADRLIFCHRNVLCWSSKGDLGRLFSSTAYAARSPRLNAKRRSRSHACGVLTRESRIGCKRSSPKL